MCIYVYIYLYVCLDTPIIELPDGRVPAELASYYTFEELNAFINKVNELQHKFRL